MQHIPSHITNDIMKHNFSFSEDTESYIAERSNFSILNTVLDEDEEINEELDITHGDLVNNIPPPLRKKSEN